MAQLPRVLVCGVTVLVELEPLLVPELDDEPELDEVEEPEESPLS
jgi:hypothetical protein